MEQQKFNIYFSKLFSSIILKNKIVSTILYNISKMFNIFLSRADITLNEDI